ncbi:Hypothetical protein LOCK900_1109 [Lacticaseibacillus rhamnosus LOCK900]|nr:Hypothetical protein LOCK900_1109 [Lacticaseibacillus rhamnosus LOCK900]
MQAKTRKLGRKKKSGVTAACQRRYPIKLKDDANARRLF